MTTDAPAVGWGPSDLRAAYDVWAKFRAMGQALRLGPRTPAASAAVCNAGKEAEEEEDKGDTRGP